MSKIKYQGGLAYSTNQTLKIESDDDDEIIDVAKAKQKLRVVKDAKKRAGKTVTLVENYVGKDDDIDALCKLLKTKCGCGGSAKDGLIIIQGDVVTKVKEILIKEGYTVK
jgi:translation initiation factor 1